MVRRTRVGLLIGGMLLLVVAGFLVWALQVMPAEKAPLDAVRFNPAITIVETDHSFIMRPKANDSTRGLVFLPGAKVDPQAYFYKLSSLVERDNLTVVITKPILNLAYLDPRPLSAFTADLPASVAWYVGGHSLGGVKACQYAATERVHGLILFGAYCPNQVTLPTLSVAGSNDGLSTPDKIKANAHWLPADTLFYELSGANHASFGDYGPQAGDGQAVRPNEQIRNELGLLMHNWLHDHR